MPSARSTTKDTGRVSKAVSKRKRSSGTSRLRRTRQRRLTTPDPDQEDQDDDDESSENFGPLDDDDDDESNDEEIGTTNDNPPRRSPAKRQSPTKRHSPTKRIAATIPTSIPKPSYEPSCNTSTREAKDINYFFARGKKIRGEAGEPTICIFCRDQYEKDPKKSKVKNFTFSARTSNTTLRVHLDNHHQEVYKTFCRENNFPNRLPSFKLPGERLDDSGQPNARVIVNFSSSELIKHLVNFIVEDDLLIRTVESRRLRELLLLLRPELKDSEIPRRTKVHEEVMRSWTKWFKALTQELAAACGRVSLTADEWTDRQQLRSYICLTAHWIGRDPQSKAMRLRNEILAFHHLPHDSHGGAAMAAVIVEMVDRAEITAKIRHLTLDNVSVNEKMMETLEKTLDRRGIPFSAKDNRIRCFPHVINICVQHVLTAFENSTVIGDVPETNYESWKRAARRKPIARLRALIRTLRKSGKRREAFRESIRAGNEESVFVDPEAREQRECKMIKVPELNLLRDVDTRWDSVYYMITRARTLRPAIENFIARNKSTNVELDGIDLSKNEWAVLRDFEMILYCAHEVQMVMAKEATPVLSGAIPSIELFMTKWESLAENHPNLRPFIDAGLAKAREYYRKMDLTRAYVVALVLNPMIKMSWIKKHWDSEYAGMAEQMIKEEMRQYRDSHQSQDTTPAQSLTSLRVRPSRHVEVWHNIDSRYGLSDMKIMPDDSEQMSVEDEYMAYILAPLSRAAVDLVAFWEMSKHQHPTLHRMAMDYLPIQASAVPCERAFSSGAETLTARRNRIEPHLMEALQMLKFSLKIGGRSMLNFTQDWVTPEQLMDEEEEEEDSLKQRLQIRAGALDNVLEAAAEDSVRSVDC